MINSILKDFMISYLQSEYMRYSENVNKYYEHVERCHTELILNNTERNQHLKVLNNLIKMMNNIYNDKIILLKSRDVIEQELNELDDSSNKNSVNNQNNPSEISNSKELIDLIQNNNINYTNQIINMIGLYESLNIKKLYGINLDFFYDIKNKLLQISNSIGFFNMDSAFDIIIGKNYNSLLTDNKDNEYINMFNIITKYFIPMSFKKNKSQKQILDISCNICSSDLEVLLDNFYEIEINIPFREISLTFRGYFVYDSINILIATSQICKPYVYNRKKKIHKLAFSKLKYISEKFKNIYIKNMNIGDILSFDKDKFIEKLENDYDKYNKLSKLPFKNLMQEFLDENATIKTQFNIIKLFLIGGTEENINMAGLLFGLTKDKKFGNDYLSNIIYKNLNFVSQTKLRKSSVSIKNELDKLKNMSPDDVDVKKRIATCKNMPQYVKKICLDKVEEMKSGGSEYYKQKVYLDILLGFPWPSPNNDDNDIFKSVGSDLDESRKFLDNLKNSLDSKVYGHDECKLVIQKLIGKWLTNPKSSGKAIGLEGPPGVGKTMIAKALGDALGIPFTQINLGGMEDRCILSGHSYTYSAAQPGLIVRKMVDAGKPRCIMYFDELDKACTKHGINEIFNVLIHVTDPNTNSQFSDAFFNEITFRLDKVLFVFSYNDPSKIDKILLDRMEKIEVKPYTITDKLSITKNFLIKEISTDIGIDPNYVKFEDNDIEYLIDNFTFEPGVRELKRKLESIYLKLNLDRIYKKGVFENSDPNNILIKKEHIDSYLNKPNLNIKKIHDIDDIGIISGLYATNSGSGGIIPILIYPNFLGTKNKFLLKLTGSQGKVMKESVHFAFTTAMNLIKNEFRQQFLESHPFGLHIHTPDGATPKDGPSAGSAFTTAFVSRILNKKIKKDVAMTGEIEMNGNITAIGGLEYKLKGAQKAGVKIAFVPFDNKEDLDKIYEKDDSIKKDISIHLVKHISEILKLALIEDTNVKTRGRKKKSEILFDPSIYLNNQFLL